MATILTAQQIVTLTAHNEHLLPYLIANTYLAFFLFLKCLSYIPFAA
jgi:hypothetical protein